MSAAGTVVIAAGGTGGHIYPAIAVARVLETRKVPVVWIGTKEGLESRIVPEANIDIRFINVSGLRGKGLRGLLTGPFKVLYACVQSVRILADVQAKSVLGMGGFVSGPVGIAALLTRRVLVLHEQNAVAGMTNKWLGRLATRVYSAMPNVFPEKVGALAIGNPVRESIESVGLQKISNNQSHSDKRNALKVLVVGGSRGARALNEAVPKAIQTMLDSIDAEQASRIDLHIWHQTGPADQASVSKAYETLQAECKSVQVAAYIDDMSESYLWADVIICRAGAMTVSELSAAALPGLLVPFPHHADDHQTRNAMFLVDAGAAILLPQDKLTAESLSQELRNLIDSPQALTRMSKAARQLHQEDAAIVVADALQEASN